MPIPEFIVEIRRMIGHHEMWLPGVTAVVTRGDDILLVRRADNGAWTPITGIPEPGEEPGLAAAREALEETGVVVSVDRLASTSAHPGIVHANGDKASYLDLTFAAATSPARRTWPTTSRWRCGGSRVTPCLRWPSPWNAGSRTPCRANRRRGSPASSHGRLGLTARC